jgi:hypothetical protein
MKCVTERNRTYVSYIFPKYGLDNLGNQKLMCLLRSSEKSFDNYRMSQKWRTNGALRCRRDYRKRQKNVKKILLDLFADLAVFESGT